MLLAFSFVSFSQTKNYYLAYFSDKTNTPYTLTSPLDFLTQKSIDRRSDQGYPLTELDLPVDPDYVDSLKLRTVEVTNTSRWFNAALVYADSTLVADSVQSLSFVDSVAILSNYGISLNLRKQSRNKFASETYKTTNTSTSNLSQLSMLEVYDMHAYGYDGDGVTIAVMDNGFSNVDIRTGFSHLFTNNQILGTYDFVNHETNVYNDGSHGTFVLSVIGGKNGEDNLGAAPNSHYYLFKTEDDGSEFPIEEINWLLALERADSLGVDIVNTSLGYYDFDDPYFNYTYQDTDGKTAYSSKAARIAARTGMLLVNSAGNEGNNSWQYVTFPADADSVLSIGAVNSSGKYASFSSIGPTIDNRIKPNVVAQGDPALVLSNAGDYTVYADGTSFSTPLITGFAAAIWEAYDTLTNMQLKQLIEQAGSDYHSPTAQLGYGIPTFSQIQINMILNEYEGVLVEPAKITPNPVSDGNLLIFVPAQDIGNEATILISDSKGNEIYKETVTFTSELYISEFDYANVEAGLYYLRVFSKGYSKGIKVLKVE